MGSAGPEGGGALATLLLPLARGRVAAPSPAQPAFLIRARPHPDLMPWRDSLRCEQTFRPDFEALQAQGFAVTSRLEGRFALGLVRLTKHRLENLLNLARAATLLGAGGVLMAAADNTLGAARWHKTFESAFGPAESLVKHKARVFWTRLSASLAPMVEEWRTLEALQPIEGGAFLSRPGVFSWDGVDAGSALLARHFGPEIAGRVADLGAGWGYLARRLLETCPGIAGLDLVEAEDLALEAARANLAATAHAARLRFLWADATRGLEGRAYDWVVTNPPFHEGKAQSIALGQAFLKTALAALKPGGRLLLVANRHLPYEAILTAGCREVRSLADEGGFKVLRARL